MDDKRICPSCPILRGEDMLAGSRQIPGMCSSAYSGKGPQVGFPSILLSVDYKALIMI